MNNTMNFFQSMASSMLAGQVRPQMMGMPLQGFRPGFMSSRAPFSGDGSRMSREAAGGMSPFLQAGDTGAFFEGMMNMLMQSQNGGLGQNQNLQGGQGLNEFQGLGGAQPGTWSQGGQGNCASVATIKAAQQKFGDKMFKNVQQTADGGYQVTLQDGKTVSLTKDELDTAKRMSGFKGQGAGLESAQLAYAVMAKNALASGHEGARTFAQACNSLNNGENPFDSAKFLGIENHVKAVDPGTAAASSAAVVWSNQHALFESGGTVDKYGQRTAFNGTDTLGNRLSNAFILV